MELLQIHRGHCPGCDCFGTWIAECSSRESCVEEDFPDACSVAVESNDRQTLALVNDHHGRDPVKSHDLLELAAVPEMICLSQ